QRGGVTVVADTEKDQIEAGPRPAAERKKIAQDDLIRRGCALGTALGFDAMNVFSRNRDFREQRFMSHAVIAVGMVRGHRALISPEKMNPAPENPLAKFRPGELGVQRPRRVSAGKRDGESARAVDRLTADSYPFFGGFAR